MLMESGSVRTFCPGGSLSQESWIDFFDKLYYILGVMLQFESLRGPLDWGVRLLGQAPRTGMEGLGRAFDGAGVAFTQAGRLKLGITYRGPSDATMTRI
jgi:hypothetical protein